MEGLLAAAIIVWIVQVIISLIFISSGDGDEIGIESKTQAIFWLCVPFYVLIPIGKAIWKGIQHIIDEINNLD